MRLQFSSNALDLEVEDHGKGGVAVAARSGIGLVAMRERAELARAAPSSSRSRRKAELWCA